MWKEMLVVLFFILLGFAVFTEELYCYVFTRNSSKLFMALFDKKGHEDHYYEVRDQKAEALRQQDHETWTMKNQRGQTLQGYYYPNGAGGKQVAFLVHGYRSNAQETAGMFYDYYKSRGIDLFCCDHVASGRSEGKFIGFDVFETEDCLQWIEFLKEKLGDDVQIMLHGLSMGGATVLRMSSRCPENVKCIISDSGFICAKASMDHQIGPMYYPLRLLNKWIAGYDWNDSDVTQSLLQSQIPILFVHGGQDKLVPFQNGSFLYTLYQGPKETFFVEKARHIECMYVNPEGYARKLDKLREQYLS